MTTSASTGTLPGVLREYRERVLEETQFVNLHGIPLPRDRSGRYRPIHIPLDKVYIHVQAIEEKYRREQEELEKAQVRQRLWDKSRFARQPKDILVYLRDLGEHLYQRGQVYMAAERPEPIDPQVALNKHGRLVIL